LSTVASKALQCCCCCC